MEQAQIQETARYLEYVMAQVAKTLDAAKTDRPKQMAQLRRPKAGPEKEIENLADASGRSAAPLGYENG